MLILLLIIKIKVEFRGYSVVEIKSGGEMVLSVHSGEGGVVLSSDVRRELCELNCRRKMQGLPPLERPSSLVRRSGLGEDVFASPVVEVGWTRYEEHVLQPQVEKNWLVVREEHKMQNK